MARRITRIIGGQRSQVRESLWLFIAGAATTVTGATLLSTLNAAAAALLPFTIVRTRIEAMIRSDQTAASEDQVLNFGMAVVSGEAAAVGITAIPTPVAEQGSDLFFVHQIMMNTVQIGAAGIQPYNTYTIDSKAMRKVSTSEDVVVVAEIDATANSSGTVLFHSGRMLVKLH